MNGKNIGGSIGRGVTLVRSANKNILVDCGDPWNGEEILRQLSLFGLEKTDGNSVTLTPAVELRRCPGHTDHDLIVVASNTERGRIVISGDIFECASDDAQWREVSKYPVLQAKSRLEIEEIADWIVPGHGPMFKNEKRRH
ncbi:hypothetical protein TELCIR_19739 [Teladorsagia circumcincta]|uniref:Metallo-beta-lactamase domain-containing protein n=1 Tax=Teladorsagia circumcincta TaxID=45464 RepID=A0A2G9TLF8_TELCI|nr:hypothetical protein TELCIR_19739 [Teladorsagia circumcincta]